MLLLLYNVSVIPDYGTVIIYKYTTVKIAQKSDISLK
jgi:hypothetical protein